MNTKQQLKLTTSEVSYLVTMLHQAYAEGVRSQGAFTDYLEAQRVYWRDCERENLHKSKSPSKSKAFRDTYARISRKCHNQLLLSKRVLNKILAHRESDV